MKPIVAALFAFVVTLLRSRVSMQVEIIALRHQLTVCQRTAKRLRTEAGDRLLWSCLARVWSRWRDALFFVHPETIVAWQKRRFREHWTRLSRHRTPGRPMIANEVRALIRRMSEVNPMWGSPRIVGELGKLGIEVAKSTVEKYRVRSRKPASPTWRAFWANHVKDLVAIDFFTVSTIRNTVLFVLLVLAHDRRRVVHFNVTEHPTAQWSAQQIVEAFPWDTAPKYLRRDRDMVYGAVFRRRVASLGIEEILTAPRSPWQNRFVERPIGSVRRECLDHVIVLSERHLQRVLTRYFRYYHDWRTHRALAMDTPIPRRVPPPASGRVIETADVGGLHHHYKRLAA
ncbi:MAG: integrase core domain-containing protein [Nitrospirota bacterium]